MGGESSVSLQRAGTRGGQGALGWTQPAVPPQLLHRDPSKVKLLQPVAVFIPAPQHATALVLVFILLSPLREKGSCSSKRSVEGLCCSADLFDFPCLHSPPSNSQPMSIVDRHSAMSEMVWCMHRGMLPLRRQAQGWSKVRQGCIWLFWQWTAAVGSISATERGWLLLHAPWGMKAVGGEAASSSRCKHNPHSLGCHGPWFCSLDRVVPGHMAGLPTNSPQQLLCLPVLCLLWKKTPGTKASIQTQADTAHLGLAGSSPSGFKASERMGLAKGNFAACISLEKLCLLCYQFLGKGPLTQEGQNYMNLTLILWGEGKQATFYRCGFVWVFP